MISGVRLWTDILFVGGYEEASQHLNLLDRVFGGELGDLLRGVKSEGTPEDLDNACWDVYNYLMGQGVLDD